MHQGSSHRTARLTGQHRSVTVQARDVCMHVLDATIQPRRNNTHTHTHTHDVTANKNKARKAVERKLLRDSSAILDVFRLYKDTETVQRDGAVCNPTSWPAALWSKANYSGPPPHSCAPAPQTAPVIYRSSVFTPTINRCRGRGRGRERRNRHAVLGATTQSHTRMTQSDQSPEPARTGQAQALVVSRFSLGRKNSNKSHDHQRLGAFL